MSIKPRKWLLFDADTKILRETQPLNTKWMRQRYFYVEKCKDASTIGIVVGTLTAKGYLDVVKHIQQLAKNRGVRSYLISVGKVNPAKLANFAEIDCFVLVGCPENNTYSSKDFYKPLVSVFEVEMALNPAWHLQFPDTYSTEFKDVLPDGKLFRDMTGIEVIENDISLVTGRVRNYQKSDVMGSVQSTEILERSRNEVSVGSSGEQFRERSWQGLDPALGQHKPSSIEKGRSGIAIKYSENVIE